MTNEQNPSSGFYTLGIAPKFLGILDSNKFTKPTPIQERAIPIAIEGKDLMGIAQTGTGKTLAFGIPMIQRLSAHGGKGLVILPTRELALQVDEMLARIAGAAGFRTAVLIGGASMERQSEMIRRNPQIIIATPGRLQDHLNRRGVNLDDVKVLILDEADRMLDMGFAPQINKILNSVPKDRQTMLFSATMPTEIARIAAHHMKLPVRVEVAPSGTTSETVTQEIFFVEKHAKTRLLDKLLEEYKGSILVFTRTKHGAKKVTRSIRDMHINAAEIHGNRSLNQRRDALEGFKSGRYRVLVATDIAARGIDVTGVELVVNYDLPSAAEDYVHRIGRTGRAGRSGHAISFATPDQRNDVRDIERLVRKALPTSVLPQLPPDRPRLGGGFPDREERREAWPDRHGRPQFHPRPQGQGGRRPAYPPHRGAPQPGGNRPDAARGGRSFDRGAGRPFGRSESRPFRHDNRPRFGSSEGRPRFISPSASIPREGGSFNAPRPEPQEGQLSADGQSFMPRPLEQNPSFGHGRPFDRRESGPRFNRGGNRNRNQPGSGPDRRGQRNDRPFRSDR